MSSFFKFEFEFDRYCEKGWISFMNLQSGVIILISQGFVVCVLILKSLALSSENFRSSFLHWSAILKKMVGKFFGNIPFKPWKNGYILCLIVLLNFRSWIQICTRIRFRCQKILIFGRAFSVHTATYRLVPNYSFQLPTL